MGAPPLEKLFGGPFSLTDQEGRARTEKDFRGRYLLLTFGYTHCPDICPTNLNAMAAALDRLGTAAAKATPVLISVDPERGTPAVLKDYLANFGPRFVGLTGTREQVLAAARHYHVHIRLYQREGRDGHMCHKVDPARSSTSSARTAPSARSFPSTLRRNAWRRCCGSMLAMAPRAASSPSADHAGFRNGGARFSAGAGW